MYIASSYLCYNTPLGTTAETGLDAWDVDLGLLHSWSKDAQQLSATQQRPTSTVGAVGPCANLTTQYAHAIYTCYLRATEDYYVNVMYTKNCTLDKMADIIEVSKMRSSFLTKYFLGKTPVSNWCTCMHPACTASAFSYTFTSTSWQISFSDKHGTDRQTKQLK